MIGEVYVYHTEKGCKPFFMTRNPLNLLGGAEGSRTPGLLNAIQALSQLSYSPGILK